MCPAIRSIVFDFDYTLADSSPGIVESVNYALRKLGLLEVSQDRICAAIGLSLPTMLTQLAGPAYASRSEDFAHLFIQRADEVMVNRTVVLEGVSETMRSLKSEGFSTGIVSTKFRHRIESVLSRESLLTWFDTIVGGEDVTAHKPDPEGLLTAIGQLKSQPANCLYVGDSVTDAETAERAGVNFVAVLSGVTPRDEFINYRVARVLRKISELPSFLREWSHLNAQGASLCQP
jgi:phosphoglycolate phosphatase